MAIAVTLIESAKLNKVDPQGCLIWVLGQIADHKITRLDELLPWRYAAKTARLRPWGCIRPRSTARSLVNLKAAKGTYLLFCDVW